MKVYVIGTGIMGTGIVAGLIAQGKVRMKSGEAFLQWTPETIKAAKAAYERKLKAAFELL